MKMLSRQDQGEHSPGGFTLLEILVSIGIIAVLVVILASAVPAMKNAGLAAACAGNLRSIGLDVRNFAHDNDGYLPANSSAGTKTAWWYVLYANDGFQNFNKRMVCPADPSPYIFKHKHLNATLKSSFRYNTRMGRRNSLGVWLFPPRKLHLINNAKGVPLVVEWNDPDELDESSDSRDFGASASFQLVGMHGRSSNVLFLDGHVGKLTKPPVESADWVWTLDPP